jgi:hypothetical protein
VMLAAIAVMLLTAPVKFISVAMKSSTTIVKLPTLYH